MSGPTPDRTARLPLVCVTGPTGAGKSGLALYLARALAAGPGTPWAGCAVINADSRQVYRDFPLVTAQPDTNDHSVCPHHLYGFLPTKESFGAGAFARAAAEAIDDAFRQSRLPVLVGGTGLYFRTLLQGIAPIPRVPDEIQAHWQGRLAAEGAPALHRLLSEQDSVYAAKIHPNDPQRITRALAVRQSTGENFSWWHAQPLPPSPYHPLMLGVGLPMPELETRLKKRISLMLEAGAAQEVEAALKHCPDPSAPGWSGIGCAELRQHLEGKLSLDECAALWLKNTRAYAKRQYTWFRADKNTLWLRPEEEQTALARVREHLRIKGAA